MSVPVKNLSAVNHYVGSLTAGFGDAIYNREGEFGPRCQPNYQLVILHLGELEVRFSGQTVAVTPGSVALLLPGHDELWRFSPHRQTHHTWVTFHPLHMPPGLQKRLALAPRVQVQSRTFDLIMKAAFALRGWRKKEGQNMSNILGLAAFHEYLRMQEAGSEEANRDSPLERARMYMEIHSAEEDCLKRAAQAAGVTPLHLIRLFRKNYQTTPGRHLWKLRIEQGAGLLAATGLTIGEIAERCGFRNPFHFSRKLREFQGICPREFRQRSSLR
jgi:AraC family transcriptional regulator of arabinose operon